MIRFIAAIIVIVIVIAANLIRLWYFIKCLGVQSCKNGKCKYREFCFRYQGGITEEEKEELLKYLEQGFGEAEPERNAKNRRNL